jgi:hypothetical protein
MEERFPSLKTQVIASKIKKDGLEKKSDRFVKEACSVCKVCFEYLPKWKVFLMNLTAFIG